MLCDQIHRPTAARLRAQSSRPSGGRDPGGSRSDPGLRDGKYHRGLAARAEGADQTRKNGPDYSAERRLDSLETMLNYIQTTTTARGLDVRAYLDTREYAKGVRVSDADMKALALKKRSELEKWNYTISPRLSA
ncbi:MAG: hypothetical protein V2A76_07555 [Planctomycetota bacterium]